MKQFCSKVSFWKTVLINIALKAKEVIKPLSYDYEYVNKIFLCLNVSCFVADIFQTKKPQIFS